MGWLEWILLNETRCRATFALLVPVLAAPCVIMFAADADPKLQMHTMSWMMASLNVILLFITIVMVMTVADNFGLRVELSIVASSAMGASVLSIITIAHGEPVVLYLVEFAVVACHFIVYNVTIVVPVVRSFGLTAGGRKVKPTTDAPDVEARQMPSFQLGDSDAPVLSPNALPADLSLPRVLGSDTLRALFQRFLVKEFRVRACRAGELRVARAL